MVRYVFLFSTTDMENCRLSNPRYEGRHDLRMGMGGGFGFPERRLIVRQMEENMEIIGKAAERRERAERHENRPLINSEKYRKSSSNNVPR